MRPTHSRLIFLLLVAMTWFLMTYFFGKDLTLSAIKEQLDELKEYTELHFWKSSLLYLSLYIGMTAISFPGASIMTLLGGALFGLWVGTLYVSFASTLGATLAFLLSRFMMRSLIQDRFSERIRTISEGVSREGAYYLFSLRLIPIFPFFIINVAFGLTALPARTFFWVSQIGMLPGTLLYVNAGKQLGQIDSLAGIISFPLLLSFALLGVFPLMTKWIIERARARRVLGRYKKPSSFDFDIVVIGAGAAGLVTSLIGAALKAKVALVEKHKFGGDCLNYGCVPSKTILKSAKRAYEVRHADIVGVQADLCGIDFGQVMQRVRHAVETIAPNDSPERYEALGVHCHQGNARLRSPYEVEINGQIVTTRSVVLATGAYPFVPVVPGIDQIKALTSETLWQLEKLPERLVVVGGGPIGCELAQAFARLGSKVTLVEKGCQLLNKEDSEVSAILVEQLAAEGVKILLEHELTRFEVREEEKVAFCRSPSEELTLGFDSVLFALGRRPRTDGFGAEELGIEKTETGAFKVNKYLQTSVPTIYACGDVVGPFLFTHVAAYQAWFCAVNALFGTLKQFRPDYRVVPWCTYTDPEVAHVGMNEKEAKQKGIKYRVNTYPFAQLDRAIADAETHGFVKILTHPHTDKILGATIVGARASDILMELVFAMKYNLGLKKVLRTIHIYPTYAEAAKYCAGAWQRENQPKRVLHFLKRFFEWRRGRARSETAE